MGWAEAGKLQGIRPPGRSIHKGTIVLQWAFKYGVRVQYRLSCLRVEYSAVNTVIHLRLVSKKASSGLQDNY